MIRKGVFKRTPFCHLFEERPAQDVMKIEWHKTRSKGGLSISYSITDGYQTKREMLALRMK